ncbi:TerD family protein [Nocardia sp. CA-084685]|uniref:TerD family protein n=1 Tax=Nocardia sp. CA-084685 TaxID=3239970 RepID=UPI003D96A919
MVVTQNPGPTVEYTAPNFTDRETVVVIAEAYRRNDAWKVRAVGQGYASGLGGLAGDDGHSRLAIWVRGQPLLPASTHPISRALFTRHQRRLTRFSRPACPWPVALGGNENPSAFP